MLRALARRTGKLTLMLTGTATATTGTATATDRGGTVFSLAQTETLGGPKVTRKHHR